MTNKLKFSDEALEDLQYLENDPGQFRILKAVRKTLGLIETNLRHPSLNTHEYKGLIGKKGEKVFGAYAQNKTSNAYRILWHYGPAKGVITILAIIPHLD